MATGNIKKSTERESASFFPLGYQLTPPLMIWNCEASTLNS